MAGKKVFMATERIDFLKATIAAQQNKVQLYSATSQKAIDEFNAQIGELVPKAIEEQNLADLVGLKADQALIGKMNKVLEQATKRRADAIKLRDDAVALANNRRVRLAESLGVSQEGILSPISIKTNVVEIMGPTQVTQADLDQRNFENVALKDKITVLETKDLETHTELEQVKGENRALNERINTMVELHDQESKAAPAQSSADIKIAFSNAMVSFLEPGITSKNWDLVGDFVKEIKRILMD